MIAERGKRPPAMADVAKLAGVSHQTVSRVLNNPEAVRPETRERVQAAMLELGYSRNLAARALVTRHTMMLGVVWTGVGFLGPSSTVGGIEVAARAAGYSTLVGALDKFDEDEVAALFQTYRDRGVEGIVVVAPTLGMAEIARTHSRGIPTLLIADAGPEVGFPTAAVDQEVGGRLATSHLIERGCKRILHISGPLDWFDAAARARGWRLALEDAGLEVPDIIQGDWSPSDGYDLGKQIIESGNLPDGIFVGNDAMAVGLLAVLREAGIDVPGEISVVGFDDLAGSGYFHPPLTTIAQPFVELGRRAVDVLVQVIQGDAPQTDRIMPELVLRQSVR